MKRFFCIKCQKIKRVQKWPNVLENQPNENPTNRIGRCNWHSTRSFATNRQQRRFYALGERA